MKKFLSLIVMIAVIVFTVSCKKGVDLELYLSQARTLVYSYSCENYKVTLFYEEKESPFILDGYVGKLKKYAIIRLESNMPIDDASISFTHDGNLLTSKFVFNPVNAKFTAEQELNKVLGGDINATLSFSGESYEITLKEVASGVDGYKNALKAVSKHAGGLIESILENHGKTIEVQVRIIPEEDRNYYYVGIIESSEKIYAYLVDGVSFKILAEKTP